MGSYANPAPQYALSHSNEAIVTCTGRSPLPAGAVARGEAEGGPFRFGFLVRLRRFTAPAIIRRLGLRPSLRLYVLLRLAPAQRRESFQGMPPCAAMVAG